MTDNLRALIEAVERGDHIGTGYTAPVFGHGPDGVDRRIWARKAARGSLDAAAALHEALLPGWLPDLRQWPGGRCLAMIRPPHDRAHQGQGPTLARAWLLAVLKALVAQQEPSHER